MPAFRPRALLPLALLAAGCRLVPPRETVYPPVASQVGTRLAAGADSGWMLAGDGYVVVAADRDALEETDRAVGGVARAYRRLFGDAPAPITVLVTTPPAKRDTAPRHPTLPDSLAARPVARVAAPRRAEDEEGRSGGVFRGQRILTMPGTARTTMDPARLWVRLALGPGSDSAGTAPDWFRAAATALLGAPGMEGMLPTIEARDGAAAIIPLDTLFARRCPPGWMAAGGAAGGPGMRRGGRRGRADVGRMEDDDLSRRRDRDAGGCGMPFTAQSVSVLQYLLSREGQAFGPELAARLRAGDPIPAILTGRRALPPTVRELEVAWRAWVRDEMMKAEGR